MAIFASYSIHDELSGFVGRFWRAAWKCFLICAVPIGRGELRDGRGFLTT